MYEEFFELERRPFAFFPDASSVFWTESHSRSFAAIRDGLARQCQITLVTGEVGAGKTTMIRHMLETLPAEYTVGLISNYISKRDSILQWILSSFDQDHSVGSEPELLERFHAFVIDQYAAGRRTVLILDEAQNLSDKDIESLRLLSNINIDGNILFLIVLVGQPELQDRLLAFENRQIMQRVGSQFHLTQMSAPETKNYVRHLLSNAGAKSDVFDDDALRSIFLATSGLPRKVNILCDLCLVSAFADDTKRIDRDFVESTLKNLRKKRIFSAFAAESNSLTNKQKPAKGKDSAIDRPVKSPKIEDAPRVDATELDQVDTKVPTKTLAPESPLGSMLNAVDIQKPATSFTANRVVPEPDPKPATFASAPPEELQESPVIELESGDAIAPKHTSRNRKLAIAAACVAAVAITSLVYVGTKPIARTDFISFDVDAPQALETPPTSSDTSWIATGHLEIRPASILGASLSQIDLEPSLDDVWQFPGQLGAPSKPEVKEYTMDFAGPENASALRQSDESPPLVSAKFVSTRVARRPTLKKPDLATEWLERVRSNDRPPARPLGSLKKPVIVRVSALADGGQVPILKTAFGSSNLSPVNAFHRMPVDQAKSYPRSFGGSVRAPLVLHYTPWRNVIAGFEPLAGSEASLSQQTQPVLAPVDQQPSSVLPNLDVLEHRFGTTLKSVRVPPADSVLRLLNIDRDDVLAGSTFDALSGNDANSDGGSSYFQAALTSDRTTTATLYARAALRGHTRAAYYLGQLYETGDGVAVDFALAKVWYSLVSDENPRARERIEQLTINSAQSSPLDAPELLLSERLQDGIGEFVWTSGDGADADKFLIQFIDAENPAPIHAQFEGISAVVMSIPPSATHWRVIAVDLERDQYSPSPWKLIGSLKGQDAQALNLSEEVAPFVTIVSSARAPEASALNQFSIANRVITAPESAVSGQHVYYFYEQDREPALAIASVLSKSGNDVVLKSPPIAEDLIARPGDILIVVRDAGTATISSDDTPAKR